MHKYERCSDQTNRSNFYSVKVKNWVQTALDTLFARGDCMHSYYFLSFKLPTHCDRAIMLDRAQSVIALGEICRIFLFWLIYEFRILKYMYKMECCDRCEEPQLNCTCIIIRCVEHKDFGGQNYVFVLACNFIESTIWISNLWTVISWAYNWNMHWCYFTQNKARHFWFCYYTKFWTFRVLLILLLSK